MKAVASGQTKRTCLRSQPLDDFTEIIQEGFDCPVGAPAGSQEHLRTAVVKKGIKKVLDHSGNKEMESAS